jgi:hypothetical protein
LVKRETRRWARFAASSKRFDAAEVVNLRTSWREHKKNHPRPTKQ